MKESIKIVPLGGLGEIGMNMMVIQFGSSAVIVDCGVEFSDHRLPGIDLVVPDFSYALDPDLKVEAILLTHGHEDHIGAVPFFLRSRNVPLYSSRFTSELLENKLKEYDLFQTTELNTVKEGDQIELAPFKIEFIEMAHSISDALALCIDTPAGRIIHTGDFKIDPSPADGRKTDLNRFEELGREGVLLLLSDSTNAAVPGPSHAETSVRQELSRYIREARGWSVVCSFASHIPRIKQVVEIAMEEGKSVHLAGRGMIQNLGIARSLGYIQAPDELFVSIDEVDRIKRDRLVILSTGTQGEPRSALARMAFDQFKELKLRADDRVIMSSRMIPGNERPIYTMINHLYKRGAEVLTTKDSHIHVSGHGHRGDLEQMLRAVQPEFFVPVHGEYYHLVKHIQLAREVGIPATHSILLENGDPLEIYKGKAKRLAPIELNRSVVDGQELADIDSPVLRDRRHLANSGMVVVVLILDSHSGEIVHGPELFSRGLAFEGQADELFGEVTEVLEEQLERMGPEGRKEDLFVQEEMRLCIRRFFKNKLSRKPVVIPIVMEV